MVKREITITHYDIKNNEVVKAKEVKTLTDEEYERILENRQKMEEQKRKNMTAGFNENIVNSSLEKITEAFNEFMDCLSF